MKEPFYFALPLDEDAHRTMYGLENYIAKTEGIQADIVDFDCAIIVFPTAEQIGHLKNILKELLEETISENVKYYENVKNCIESKHVKVITVAQENIKLIGINQTWNLDLRKGHLPPWNLIFFKTDRVPIIVAPADLDDNLVKGYFGGK